LLLRAKAEAANVDRHALSRAPGAMLDLAGSIGALVLGFDGTIPPRLSNVVGMVFSGTLLESFYPVSERRLGNFDLGRYDLRGYRWRRDFWLHGSHVSPFVAWDVESHEEAPSSVGPASVAAWSFVSAAADVSGVCRFVVQKEAA
jgi:hypothetical protein